MEPISGDTLRGHLDALVLSALAAGATHGFDIWRRLEEAGGGALRLKEGSLYPALYRLEAAGFISGEWEAAGVRRGPRRRTYRLTPEGSRRLTQARDEWRRFVTVIGGIMGAPA